MFFDGFHYNVNVLWATKVLKVIGFVDGSDCNFVGISSYFSPYGRRRINLVVLVVVLTVRA